ncbi:hypothetical protein ACFVWG_10820 [Kribbella sp. NPDC058245]|uniref:hypothetical protein n=1 Tax=Kribbella sp. NPDC058245 TaxID=3346399 RepID=UPI0036E3E7D3
MMIRSLVAAVPLVGTALIGMPAAQAAPNADLTVTEMTMDKTLVAVAGLNTVPVTLTVKASYTGTAAAPTLYVIFQLSGTGPGPSQSLYSTPLKLISGTPANGTWRGPVNVSSSANGAYYTDGIQVGRFDPASGDTTNPAQPPESIPLLRVSGRNIPHFSAKVTPNPVPAGKPYSVRWSVINSATGKAYGTRLKVALGNGAGCSGRVDQVPTVLTDTAGYVTRSYPSTAADSPNCLLVPGTEAPLGGLDMLAPRATIISATPARASAPVGTIVPVNGTVAGPPVGCEVLLQRLYGASQWRTVGRSTVRSSGRFTLDAQPAYKGSIPYRAWFWNCRNYPVGNSKTFYIKGT